MKELLCNLIGGSSVVSPKEFPLPDTGISETGVQQAILAGGCFWCVEAVFTEVKGVTAVESGYAGGSAETANYRAVCSGATDHAEVIRIEYDADQTSFAALLRLFFSVAHDPTQLNRQGNDRGRQYRSAIFPVSEDQKRLAEAYIQQLNEAGVFNADIVTTVEPLETFYKAEDYHQNYAALNPNQPYIAAVSTPKVDKLKASFPEVLKN